MNTEKLLDDFKKGKIAKKAVLEKLKNLPFHDLGFAKVDNHRKLRKGFPEVLYCTGKTKEQIMKIIAEMDKHDSDILLTRADNRVFEAVKEKYKNALYNKKAGIIIIRKEKIKKKKGLVLIITAGTADIPVAEEAAVTAELLGNKVEKLYDVGVAGVHRLLSNRKRIEKANVLVVAAGMEGALPSVVSGLTSKPLIAVPTSVGYGSSFKGLSALLAMLNCCSPGVVVVNIDNGFGAGYFANLINK